MTIQQLQDDVDQWIVQYGVRYFDPMTNMVLLMEEVGEMAKIMARKFGEQSFKRKESESTSMDQLKDEYGDVLFVLVCIANQTGMDITELIKENLEKKTIRDRNRHKNNPKLDQ